MEIKIDGPGQRLKIYTGQQDNYKGGPFYKQLVLKLREAKIAGATVYKGILGYGAQSHIIHDSGLLRLSEDLPVIIEIVDTKEEVQNALKIVEAMIDECGCGVLMTLENLQILRYHPGKK